jgi:hypothetical protein
LRVRASGQHHQKNKNDQFFHGYFIHIKRATFLGRVSDPVLPEAGAPIPTPKLEVPAQKTLDPVANADVVNEGLILVAPIP